nr:MAG TPA: hypothetical protein [Caudoviricetes sp.]
MNCISSSSVASVLIHFSTSSLVSSSAFLAGELFSCIFLASATAAASVFTSSGTSLY